VNRVTGARTAEPSTATGETDDEAGDRSAIQTATAATYSAKFSRTSAAIPPATPAANNHRADERRRASTSSQSVPLTSTTPSVVFITLPSSKRKVPCSATSAPATSAGHTPNRRRPSPITIATFAVPSSAFTRRGTSRSPPESACSPARKYAYSGAW